MSLITAIAFTGALNEYPLRFFKAPLEGTHLPWHSIDDLQRCLELPRDIRRAFQRDIQAKYKRDVRTVATAKGITTIGPHWMAQGLMGAMVETQRADASVQVAYAQQIAAAWDALMGHLGPLDRFAHLLSAVKEDFCGGAA